MAKIYKLNPNTGKKEWVDTVGEIARKGGNPADQFGGQYSYGGDSKTGPIEKPKSTDTSTTSQKQNTGITLPDLSTTNSDQSSTSATQKKSLISMSTPAVNITDITAANDAERRAAATAIEGKYGAEITAAKEQGVQEVRATEAQLGTGRRFSSSAGAYVKFIENENDKKVKDWTTQMETALANNDIKFAENLQQKIKEERANQQQEFENMFKTIQLEKDLKEYEAEKNKPFITASREAAIADIYSQGVTDPGEISKIINFSEGGQQIGDITLKEISDTVKNLGAGGMADIVIKNPILFSKLSSTQLATIIPELASKGFDFQNAIDIAAKKKIVAGVVSGSSTAPVEGQYVAGKGILRPDGTYTPMKLTAAEAQDVSDARLSGQDTIQFFLNTDPAFKKDFTRSVIETGANNYFSLSTVKDAYNLWSEEKKKGTSSSTRKLPGE